MQDAGQLYILYLTAFVVMGLGAVFIPARNASIPNMVPEEHLLTANALIQATELVSLIVGASLATLVIGLTSTTTAFVVDSITFLVSALFLVAARIPAGQTLGGCLRARRRVSQVLGGLYRRRALHRQQQSTCCN